jgi:hypothetical protein
LNYCQRYALVCLPVLCLFAGAAVQMFQGRIASIAMWSIVGTTVWTGIWHSENSLSYYNALCGGPAGGRYYLHGNATDWGQDGLRIGRWCQDHPERRPLAIATVGFPSSLRACGIVADSLRFEVDTRADWDLPVRGKEVSAVGWHIVSFVHLLDPRSPYHCLLYRKPIESIGCTHQVFYIDKPMADQISKHQLNVLPDS